MLRTKSYLRSIPSEGHGFYNCLIQQACTIARVKARERGAVAGGSMEGSGWVGPVDILEGP